MNSIRSISVVGLGYVGLPVAAAFGRVCGSVVAFDINEQRIIELQKGIDRTNEVSAVELMQTALKLTTNPGDLAAADFHIVTVPTPIDSDRRPDLRPLEAASETVGAHLKAGDIVVYESTVYPGVTEDVCVPILERISGLRLGHDFSVGYSPERINPGDKKHRLETIVKVVSGSDSETLDIIADVYSSVAAAGIHRAPSIKTAEAAKVIENTQRDLNIALMNELSVIFGKLGIDTHDVLAAAGTKWNFLPFVPGLVGGHCIGVDPYYLTHRAEQAGYHSEVILAGRRINDSMGTYIAQHVAEGLGRNGKVAAGQTVTVMGITFKENVPDVRNTKIADMIGALVSLGLVVQVFDPVADQGTVWSHYGLRLLSREDLAPADAVIAAVPHAEFVQGGWSLIENLLNGGHGFVADIKGYLDRAAAPDGITVWRL